MGKKMKGDSGRKFSSSMNESSMSARPMMKPMMPGMPPKGMMSDTKKSGKKKKKRVKK